MGIGKRMRDRRMELNLSVEDLAVRLNKNRTTVYRYEKGDIENLPLDTLKPLADILETTPAYLMGWEDKNAVSVNGSPLESDNLFKLIMLLDREQFNDEEYGQIVEYAGFVAYKRGNK